MPREFGPTPEQTPPKPIDKLAEFLRGEKSGSRRWLAADDFIKVAIYKHELRRELEVEKRTHRDMLPKNSPLIEFQILQHKRRLKEGSPEAEEAILFEREVFSSYLQEAKTAILKNPTYKNSLQDAFESLAKYKAAKKIQQDFLQVSSRNNNIDMDTTIRKKKIIELWEHYGQKEISQILHIPQVYVRSTVVEGRKNGHNLPPKTKGQGTNSEKLTQQIIALWPNHEISKIAKELCIPNYSVRSLAAKARLEGHDLPFKSNKAKRPDLR